MNVDSPVKGQDERKFISYKLFAPSHENFHSMLYSD